MSISIKKATKKDVSLILELLYEMGRPKPKSKSEKTCFRKQILHYLSAADKEILVAKTNSKVVGLASMILLCRLNQTKKELYIPELVITRNYRRMGVGKLLMDSCISTAKKNGCYRIRLESGYQRKEAHRFYKKLGFKQPALTYTKTFNSR